MFETSGDVDLRRLLLHHQDKLKVDLDARSVFTHPTAKGDVGEGAWVSLLSKFLPNRYQVSKAFVLDARGRTSQQLDVVVHDRHFCPLLFEQNDHCYIPAESVYAVFEVRPSLDHRVVAYAADKARSVRQLHRTSRPLVDRGVSKPAREPFEIIAGVLTTKSDWTPPFGDPLLRALTNEDPATRLQIGCAPEHGAFEAHYDSGLPEIETVNSEGAVMFFLLRLFHLLQMIGSPMGIDLREYSRSLNTPGRESHGRSEPQQ